jgi:hypothetical protein
MLAKWKAMNRNGIAIGMAQARLLAPVQSKDLRLLLVHISHTAFNF